MPEIEFLLPLGPSEIRCPEKTLQPRFFSRFLDARMLLGRYSAGTADPNAPSQPDQSLTLPPMVRIRN